MTSQIVKYKVDDSTEAAFVIDPDEWAGWQPCGDVATLLVDELFANSIRHSGSGAPGETVTAVKTADDVIRVEGTDPSAPGVPQPRHSGSEAEDGRGLRWRPRSTPRS